MCFDVVCSYPLCLCVPCVCILKVLGDFRGPKLAENGAFTDTSKVALRNRFEEVFNPMPDGADRPTHLAPLSEAFQANKEVMRADDWMFQKSFSKHGLALFRADVFPKALAENT